MRNEKGQFIKGTNPAPPTQFSKGFTPWNKGKKCPQIALAMKGNTNGKGKVMSAEHKEKFCKANKGKIRTEETKKKQSEARKKFFARGGRPPNYILDRSKVKLDTERGGPLHKEWSKSVKKRDGWKCRIADENCSGKVVAHHILSWRDFVELRYKTNNGITLCHAHHPRKRADEAKLSPFFQELVAKGN